MCVVGAIVISGVLSCFEFGEFVYLWKIHKLDCLTWAVSFCVTIFVSISAGVLSALLLSLLIIQYENAKPHIPLLGRLPNSTVYRDMTQYSEAAEYPGLAICRIDASLYFCNAQYIREVCCSFYVLFSIMFEFALYIDKSFFFVFRIIYFSSAVLYLLRSWKNMLTNQTKD